MRSHAKATSAIAVICGSILCLLSFSATAAADTVVPQIPSLSHDSFDSSELFLPCGVATDSEGDLYMADYVLEEVFVYDSSGDPLTSFKPTANFGGDVCSLAVDSQGRVYAANANELFEVTRDVARYAPSSYPPNSSTTYAPDASLNDDGVLVPKEAEATSVAVNPENDHVYVVEEGTHASEYAPDGTLVSSTIGEGVSGISSPDYYGIDVYGKDASVYLTDRANQKAYVLNAAGNTLKTTIDGSNTPSGAFGAMSSPMLTVDQQNGNVVVSDVTAHRVFDEFDAEGNYLTTIAHSSPTLHDASPSDVVIDGGEDSPNQGTLYVTSSDEGTFEGHVFAYGPLPVAGPELTVAKTGPGAGTVGGGSAAEPDAIECGSTCKAHFKDGDEITLTATAAPGSRLNRWTGCNSASANQCTLTLEADRTITATFTAKPTISTLSYTAHDTSARLRANVDPNEEQTSYLFEYLSEAEYQQGGESFSTATKVPATPESIGAGLDPIAVAQPIGGLQPQTAYRFRVLASNIAGDSEAEGSFRTHGSSQSFGACPNEELRAGSPSASLPDCRAYEQASPVVKNGSGVGGTVRQSKASPDGDAVAFEVAGGIPGGEGSQEFPTYVAKRGATNWSTQGLLPPASAGEVGYVLGATSDFSQVFDQAQRWDPGQEGFVSSMLAISSADRSMATVSPYTPGVNYAFSGASEDGSIALFNTEASDIQPLPEAVPGKINLYVWQRGGSLRLAGVLPDGTPPTQGAGAGPITAGSSYVLDNHAFAADGSSVFFTDYGNGKLYLRLNPTAPETTAKVHGNCVPDPDLACTIQINASEKHNGHGLGDSDAAGPRGAQFMTATPDGQVAYFTSSEKLTDDANTGAEPEPAAIARAEIGGGDKRLGFLPASARGVAVDGSYIYWADPKDEAIGRATLDGTTEVDPQFIHIPPIEVNGELVPADPQDVAVDSGHLYWTNSVEEEGRSLRVTFQGKYVGQDVPRMECTVLPRATDEGPGLPQGTCEVSAERDGGGGVDEQQTLTLIGSGPSTRITLTCDGETTGEIGSLLGVQTGEVRDALEATCGAGNFSILGGAGLGTIGRADIGGDAGSIEPSFIGGASDPRGIDVDSGHVYWVNAKGGDSGSNGGPIARADIVGSPASVEQEFIEHEIAIGIAVDATSIYYSYQSGNVGVIRRRSIDGSDSSTENVAVQPQPEGSQAPPIAIDDSHLYWANPVSSEISRANLDGSSPQTGLIVGAAHPQALAVDSGHIYWAANQEVQANPGNDLYRYDATPHGGRHLTDVAVDSDDENGVEAKGVLGASEDGAYLYYVANNVPDGAVQNSPNANDEEAETGNCGVEGGACNLYLWHEGETTFIARLGVADRFDWALTPGPSVSEQKTSRIGANGRTLLFMSSRRLTDYDNEGFNELYLYREGEPGLLCVSCSPNGDKPKISGALLGSVNYPTVGQPAPTPALSRNLSANGKRVFFESTDALVAADTNGDEGCPQTGGYSQGAYRTCRDVYEWEAKGEGSCESEAQNGGCLYLISKGTSPELSLFADASADGSDVFFFTLDPLVRQDEDELVDVYDASEDGGLAAQSAPPPVPCEGEACQRGATSAPPPPSAGTSAFSGPGNPPAQHKKARKHRKKKRPHAKRHAHRGKHQAKKHQSKRAAKRNGRASR